MERVILTTGGTGGHIFPALAVAEEIRGRFPGVRILFLGGDKGPERYLAPKAGLEFVGLPAEGVLGRGWRSLIGCLRLGQGCVQAMLLLGRFRPEAVLGFGGYAAFSGVLAGVLRGVPTAVHEQNSVPGAANRLLGRVVKRIFLSYPDTQEIFNPAKAMLTGNPVRAEIGKLAECGPEEATTGWSDRPMRLLVLGGSQGAAALNTAMLRALPKLKEAGVLIRHQTGKVDFERVEAGYRDVTGEPDGVVPFIEEMAEAYGWADLVLCRAGATTAAELTVAGKPSVLVPFPYATHDHQTVNARFLEEAGAGVLLDEKQLAEMDPGEMLLGLLSDQERLTAMGRAARGLGKPHAAATVVTELERLATGAK